MEKHKLRVMNGGGLFYGKHRPNHFMLKIARHFRKVTITDAAKMMKVKYRSYKDMEMGISGSFTRELAKKAADVFNLKENFFYHDYVPNPNALMFMCKIDYGVYPFKACTAGF